MRYFTLISVISLLYFSCKDSNSPTPQPEPEKNKEFLVNTLTEGEQTGPQVAALDNGDFVVVWCSEIERYHYLIKGQLFYQEGLKIGNEFYITTQSSDNYPYLLVTSIRDGFYVQWNYFYDTHLYGLSFDNNGYRLGGMVQFDTGGPIDNRNIDTEVLNDNNIVTVCMKNIMILDPTGQTIVNQGTISTSIEGYFFSPKVCGLNDSTFVVVWQLQDPPGISSYQMHLMQQIFNGEGLATGDPIYIISYNGGIFYHQVIPLRWGYLVSWISGISHWLMGQYFDRTGEFGADRTILTGVNEHYQLFQMSRDIFGIVSYLNVDGITMTEFELNGFLIQENASYNIYEQEDDWISNVRVARILDNKAVLVWECYHEDDSNIYGKIMEY